MTEDIIKTLMAERGFLEAQLRKLAGIIHRQEEELNDLRSVNQDLKYQLTQKHEELNGTNSQGN
jgi:SMC interacting uncharacterized protein involved in chromosome segregation